MNWKTNWTQLFHTYLTNADLSEPDYDGWLLKQSKYISVWRSRYFILKENKLFFLEDPYKAPHGVIDLSDCLSVKSVEDKNGEPFCFEIKTKDERYILSADSQKAKDEWIGRIGKAIVIHSSSYKSSS